MVTNRKQKTNNVQNKECQMLTNSDNSAEQNEEYKGQQANGSSQRQKRKLDWHMPAKKWNKLIHALIGNTVTQDVKRMTVKAMKSEKATK